METQVQWKDFNKEVSSFEAGCNKEYQLFIGFVEADGPPKKTTLATYRNLVRKNTEQLLVLESKFRKLHARYSLYTDAEQLVLDFLEKRVANAKNSRQGE